MGFTIEFDDNRLIENISDIYRGLSMSGTLGSSFVDFISLGKDIQKSDHIYFSFIPEMKGRVSKDSYFYSRLIEFVDLCIKDSSLYILDNFMFFLNLEGLSLPQQHLEYHFNNPVEDNVRYQLGKSPFERAIRGFANSNKTENAITNVYTCDGIEDVCMATLYHLLKLKMTIKKCNNCGKYFIPLRRSDAIYCDRRSPFNPSKTCKEDGSQRTFEGKLKFDDVEKLRRSIYQSKQMRVIRNPDITTYKENFDKWKRDVNKWKANIKNGLNTTEEFVQWLNESKKRY